MADDNPLAGQSGDVANEYKAPHISAKIIQIFEAVPADIVEDFHATTKRENDEKARLDHAKREEARYAAKKRGLVSTNPQSGQRSENSLWSQKKDGELSTRSSASPTAGNGGGGVGSSFDNFAPSPPSTSMEGGVESSEFVPSVSQRDLMESSTGNVTAGDEEGYNSSSISLKNDALEAHLSPSKKPGTRVNSPQRSRGVEICDSSFCQASHAESLYTLFATRF